MLPSKPEIGTVARVQRIETDGSVWLIDEGTMRYCRFPKTEAGRERPEWGNADAGSLRDAVWHDMDRWLITEPATFEIPVEGEDDDYLPWMIHEPARLMIYGPEGGVSAPNPVVAS